MSTTSMEQQLRTLLDNHLFGDIKFRENRNEWRDQRRSLNKIVELMRTLEENENMGSRIYNEYASRHNARLVESWKNNIGEIFFFEDLEDVNGKPSHPLDPFY